MNEKNCRGLSCGSFYKVLSLNYVDLIFKETQGF